MWAGHIVIHKILNVLPVLLLAFATITLRENNKNSLPGQAMYGWCRYGGNRTRDHMNDWEKMELNWLIQAWEYPPEKRFNSKQERTEQFTQAVHDAPGAADIPLRDMLLSHIRSTELLC